MKYFSITRGEFFLLILHFGENENHTNESASIKFRQMSNNLKAYLMLMTTSKDTKKWIQTEEHRIVSDQ